MRLTFILDLIFSLTVLSYAGDDIPIVDGKVQFETIIEVPNKNADQLFSDCKLMISGLYSSGKSVIDVADDEAMYIVVKGTTGYVLKDWLGSVPQKVDHTLKFQFKDGRMKVTFTDIQIYGVPFRCMVEECDGYKYPKKTREKHIDGVLNIWNDLQAKIKREMATTTDNDW